MKKVRQKVLSFILAGIFLLSMMIPATVPVANAAITADDLAGIGDFVSKFQRLSTQQVQDALDIGSRIIVQSDTIPNILTDEQKQKLNSLGLTKEQVVSAYNCVLNQLNTPEQIVALQNGTLDDLAALASNVEESFDPALKATLLDKGITVADIVVTVLDVADLTFDPYATIPQSALEAIFESDLQIASETAASNGLSWANVEALRNALTTDEKNTLVDILKTIGNYPTNNSGGGGGGGGGLSTPTAVTSTTGSANVTPSAGGSISLGTEAAVEIPAGALQGTTKVEINIEKVTTPPETPSGFQVLGTVYEFTVGGQSSYSFDKPVTLTFTFDPAALGPDEVPAIYYYDVNQGKWVNIGGTVSGKTITVQVDHFTTFAVMATTKASLNDIAGHWAEDSIKQLVASGAITGYPDGSFKPDGNITRAEFATILVKAFSLAPQAGKVFTDTDEHWAKDFIATAASYGIIKGYDDTTFGPDNLITREQMAVMTVRAAKLAAVSAETTFVDASSISGWAEDAVGTVVNEGIMKGYPDNTFKPLSNATRAEAVTVIVNALK